MENNDFILSAITGNEEYLVKYIDKIDESKRFDELISLIFACKNFIKDETLENVYTRKTLSTFYNIFKENNNVAITFIDVNGLRAINDKYTMLAGDDVIKTTVTSLDTAISQTNKEHVIIRMGGDEFVIFTKGGTKEEFEIVNENAKKIAEEELKDMPYNASWADGTVNSVESNLGYLIANKTKNISNEVELLRYGIDKADKIANEKKKVNKKEERKNEAIEGFLKVLKEKNSNFEYMRFKKEIERENSNNKKIAYDMDLFKILIMSNDEQEMKEEVTKLYGMDEEKLRNAVFEIGRYCMQDREHIVARNCSSVIGEIVDNNKYKSLYYEIKNLKIVNEAYNHEGGDKYIDDALSVIKDSVDIDDKNLDNPNIVLRVSGNGFFIYVKEHELEDTIQRIHVNVDRYNKEKTEGPKLEVITIPLEEGEYTQIGDKSIGDKVKEAEELVKPMKKEDERVIKYIEKEEGKYEIFFGRNTFTFEEAINYIDKKYNNNRKEDVKQGQTMYREKSYEIIEEINKCKNALYEINENIEKQIEIEKSENIEIENEEEIIDEEIVKEIEELFKLEELSESDEEIENETDF